MKKAKRKGDTTSPCGTPAPMAEQTEEESATVVRSRRPCSVSLWRRHGAMPADLLSELYYDENDEQIRESVFGDSGDESDEPVYRNRSPLSASPPASPLASPPHSPSDSRERSRSPVWLPEAAEPEPEPLEVFVSPEDVLLMAQGGHDESLTSDAHATFPSPGQNKAGDRRGRGRSGRRARGGRRVEVSCGERERNVPDNGHQYQRSRRYQWDEAPPNEIWKTDEDVPAEFLSLANGLIKNERSQDSDRQNSEKNHPEKEEIKREEDFSEAHARADSLLESQNHFAWFPMESFKGKEERFKPVRTGSVQQYTSTYEAFRSYWDEAILGVIVAEINQHATEISQPAFQSEWYPTNTHEILCLFSFWVMLGIIRMPTIPSCFSLHPIIKTDVFRRIFTMKRYESLIRVLSFLDSNPPFCDINPSTGNTFDRLHRLRPIITYLNSKFQSNYILDRNIFIDESFIDTKDHRQSKTSGIKTFELCESITGYLWTFIAYTVRSSAEFEQLPDVLKSTAVAKQLIDPLLNQGYRLFMNDSCTSPVLARFLKHNGTDCVGTLKPSQEHVPDLIKQAPLNRGEMVCRHSNDITVLSWQDKKRITMISTCHGTSSALPTIPSRPLSRPVRFKPEVVLEYNRFMGGGDLKDQKLEPYLKERETSNLKLFKRLLNVSVLNSCVLLQSSTHTYHDQLAFRLQLVDDIITYHLLHCPQSKYVRRYSVASSTSALQESGRILHHTHWPVRLQPTANSLANCRSFRKRCVVCLRQGRPMQKTVFCCEACGVPLCIENCFKTYHTTLS